MITAAESAVSVPDPVTGKSIVLKGRGGAPLKDARSLVLLGRPFATHSEAFEAGERWADLLRMTFAKLNIGANFGKRAAQGAVTSHGLKWLESEAEERVVNDIHGISTFDYPPEPRFAGIELGGVTVGPSAERVVATLTEASERNLKMSAGEQLAYDLYASSFSESSPDARFVMLMMALETLIHPSPRSEEVAAHVERLVNVTQEADLPKEEIDSLIGSLQWLRKESISRAGRKLAEKLGGKTFAEGESAKVFFTRCYEMRSYLVDPPTHLVNA